MLMFPLLQNPITLGIVSMCVCFTEYGVCVCLLSMEVHVVQYVCTEYVRLSEHVILK